MMSRADAIAQLQSLRQEARAKAYPRSRLAIQEYMDPGTAAADAVALTMAGQAAGIAERLSRAAMKRLTIVSTSASVCAADSEQRSRKMPAGVAGGRLMLQ